MPTADDDSLVARARQLRQDSTDAERRLWRILRDRNLDAKFRRQCPFGPYILDFYCQDLRLVIEVDGGQHFEPAGVARDAHRTRVLEKSGLQVLRFTNREVLIETNAVGEAILQAIEGRKREG